MRCRNDSITSRLHCRRTWRPRKVEALQNHRCMERAFGASESTSWHGEEELLIVSLISASSDLTKPTCLPTSCPRILHSSEWATFSTNLLKMFDLLVNSSSFAGARP